MTRHSVTTTRYRDDYTRGYYSACTCGWESPTHATRRGALADGRRHLDQVAPPPPEQPTLPGLDDLLT